MKELYTDFLFSKGYFTAEDDCDTAAETVLALAELFGIDIVSGAAMACPEHIRTAQRILGKNVPEPFYRGFPDSVRGLSKDELLFDQAIHYLRTYGLGDFSTAGHSLFEGEIRRRVFAENVEARPYAVITEEKALRILQSAAEDMCRSTRPLNEGQYDLLVDFIWDYDFHPAAVNCKDTAIQLLADTRSEDYLAFLKLSDTIRLAEFLQVWVYNKKDHARLNFTNRDRKLITRAIDRAFRAGSADVETCFEKKQRWKALLHHIHYKPVNAEAADFVNAIRGDTNCSVYSAFEKALQNGDAVGAASLLKERKGEGALLRSLNLLLSRCKTEDEIGRIFSLIDGKNKIVLIQLLLQYADYTTGQRTFVFTKYERMRIHPETPEEVMRRRTVLTEDVRNTAQKVILQKLQTACKGKLGKVYIDPAMKEIALPLQETSSMSGAGVLPKGSRIPLPTAKKLRAFIYWEKVNDIDLSAFGLTEAGAQMEFSWRTMADLQSSAITYSGDETSGFNGGSEYFDILPEAMRRKYPQMRYVVFCANVFSRSPFAECVCRAGYMLRDEDDSGAVYEPKTVQSAFQVTSESTFAYLFALDLKTDRFIWLNCAREGGIHVAGDSDMAFLMRYLRAADVINVYAFARLLAAQTVDDPARADVVFSDEILSLPENVKQIRSCDIEQLTALLNL